MWEAWDRIGRAILRGLEEHRKDAAAVNRYCLEANLWLPRSASGHLVSGIKTLVDQDKISPKDIQSEYIKYFEANDWQALVEIVEGWMQNPYFKPRETIIRNALVAHCDGVFNLSIPALLPQIEGIARELISEDVNGLTGLAKKATQDFAKDYMGIAGEKDTILKLLVNPCYFASPPKGKEFKHWINDIENPDQILSRDAILHGMNVSYGSKLNSLKVFLVFDLLFWMKRDDWDEGLRYIRSRHS